MKILQVMAGAEHGGAETAFVDMCLALHEAGETLEIVTRKNARTGRLTAAGITVHTLPFAGRLDAFTRWRLGRIIKKFQPQILQTWMSRAAWHTPRWGKFMGCPRYSVVSRLGGYYKLKYYGSSDYFTTITPAIRDYLVQQGVAANRVRHINNFAEVESVATPVSRAELQTPEDAFLILAVGRLHVSKAFDTLINAVEPLQDVHVWIAGEGPERGVLETLIAAKNLQGRVKLLGWRDDRAALFQACDACVFPSRYEPFGTVFVQAWAQQKLLIASNADGPRQFVRDGEDGLLFPVDDVAALKACIERLQGDEALKNRLVRNGFERYRGEFTKEQTVRDYLGFYHEILKSPLPEGRGLG